MATLWKRHQEGSLDSREFLLGIVAGMGSRCSREGLFVCRTQLRMIRTNKTRSVQLFSKSKYMEHES